MVNLIRLKFDIVCYVHDENANDLGNDLAVFLNESWFNGEDVLEVDYTGYEVIN